MRTLVARYRDHKRSAAERRIPFKLTFDQWVSVWGDKISQRGRGIDQYVMARFGDKGPYAVGNVKICTVRENVLERDSARGSSNGNACLSEAQVVLIRTLYTKGSRRWGLKSLAARFGIHRNTVLQIVTGKTWRHLING